MLFAVLAIFAAALLAPTLQRFAPRAAHWLLSIVPAGAFFWFAGHLAAVSAGAPLIEATPWVPTLGIELAFRLDGLSLLFALLITGIGALIVVYSGGYLDGHHHQGRFLAFLLAFMGAMLGLVLADDIIALFVFWELTSVTSFLLIGFNHSDAASRRSAVQALLVTAFGGLALLAGLILMGVATNAYSLSAIAASGADLRTHDLYGPILVLILLGAFTKSAQVPFHFWLPNAMDAPTPVSAFLHSATMVKAGVYLLARMNPTLGGTDAWTLTLVVAGTATALWGGLAALRQTDLKKILAYTTLMALGTLTMLVGLGTEYAIKAFAVFLLAHSLYKGALFMGAGAVDHGSGTREIGALSGLRRAMPVTGAAMALAALSMAGLPPFFGFIGKEFMYEGMLQAGVLGVWVAVAMVLANATMLGAAGIAVWRPFMGTPSPAAEQAHEGGPALLAGPVALAALGLGLGLGAIPAAGLGEGLMGAVAASAAGRPAPVDLYLWHGLTPALGLSVVTIALGLGLAVKAGAVARALDGLAAASRVDFDRDWDRLLSGLDRLAIGITGLMQTGRLRDYMAWTFAAIAGALGATIMVRGGLVAPTLPKMPDPLGLLTAALMVIGTVATLLARSRMAAIVALSIVGLSVALFFLIYSAPDVGITQLMVETLTVIIIVLVLARLPTPRLAEAAIRAGRVRDATIAVAMGAVTTAVLLAVGSVGFEPDLSRYFAEKSYLEGFGRNVVNVILVDFRAFDTLGEITVVAVAGLGVLALLKARDPDPMAPPPARETDR